MSLGNDPKKVSPHTEPEPTECIHCGSGTYEDVCVDCAYEATGTYRIEEGGDD